MTRKGLFPILVTLIVLVCSAGCSGGQSSVRRREAPTTAAMALGAASEATTTVTYPLYEATVATPPAAEAITQPTQPVYTGPLATRLAQLCDDALLTTSQLGLMVYDLTAKTTVYRYHADALLRPASTMKLLTAITALDLLGSDHAVHTTLYVSALPSNHVLTGDIYIYGMMDPTLDETVVDSLVGCLTAMHIDTLRGNIISDRSFLDSPRWGKGWCWDDDNPILSPLVYAHDDNLSSVVWQKLRNTGMVIYGGLSSATVPSEAVVIADHVTPLSTILTTMMKLSDNQYAEAMLYNVGGSVATPATINAAQDYERQLLTKAGVNQESYHLADGSGLSLYNYLTAATEVALLRYAYEHHDIFAALYPSLPIAGVDGTLKKRMLGTAAQGNVHAKTGTVMGVSALSGYCTAANGHLLAFAIINQGVLDNSHARIFQDAVCTALCQ